MERAHGAFKVNGQKVKLYNPEKPNGDALLHRSKAQLKGFKLVDSHDVKLSFAWGKPEHFFSSFFLFPLFHFFFSYNLISIFVHFF